MCPVGSCRRKACRQRVGNGYRVSGKGGEVATVSWRDGVGLARVALLEGAAMRLRDRQIRHRDVGNGRIVWRRAGGFRIVGLEREEVAAWTWRDRALGAD